MAARMTFKGGRELEKALAELDKAATRKATSRRALKKAAEPIHRAYQVNTTVVTGVLLENEVVGTRLNRRQAAMNRKMGKSEVEIHIGTADPAGIQQEFGNVNQAANPALQPAYDAEGGDRALDRIGAEMWVDIGKTAARQAKRSARG
jgi:hypothetical protein